MLLTPVQSPLRVGTAVYVDAVNGTAGGTRGRAIALAPGETRQPFSVPAAVTRGGNTVNGKRVD